MLNRRHFLALAPTVPVFLARTARAAAPDKDRHALVVVQLDGGNDALNTIVPHADPAYESLRQGLKIASKNVVPLTDAVGLHPALKPLDKLLQAGHLAAIPGVGYPNPNRSHFESMAIWHTARLDPEERLGYGWLGRALDPSTGTAYSVGGNVPGSLRGRRSAAITLNRVEEVLLAEKGAKPTAGDGDDLLAFVRRQTVDAHTAADKLATLAGGGDGSHYPATGLGERLKLVARLMKADLGSRVYYTTQPGFDTHAAQQFTHQTLLGEFAGAVAAFFDDLSAAKLAERVTLLAFSEFGRTIRENGSVGTDHGTAGAAFLAGPGVVGGLQGTMPSLTQLEGGEPRMTTDFRAVYATVLTEWLGLPADGTFAPLPLFRRASTTRE